MLSKAAHLSVLGHVVLQLLHFGLTLINIVATIINLLNSLADVLIVLLACFEGRDFICDARAKYYHVKENRHQKHKFCRIMHKLAAHPARRHPLI